MLPRIFLGVRAPGVRQRRALRRERARARFSACGKGSRLQRALVRERQIASEATAFTFDLSKGADLLVVDVTARPGIGADVLETELVREIDRRASPTA